MMMVPLKATVWSDDSFTRSLEVRKLRTLAGNAGDTRKDARSRRNRGRLQSRDKFWFTMTALALAAFAAAGVANSVRSAVAEAVDGASARQCVIGVTVRPGDSLWTFAQKYGAPGTYILDRVDEIARDNALNPSVALVPGQKLRVHVENPVLVAKLQHAERVASTSN